MAQCYVLFPNTPVYWDARDVCVAVGPPCFTGRSEDFPRCLAVAQPGDLIVDFDVWLEPWEKPPGVLVAHYYSEALGAQARMLPEHQAHFERVRSVLERYDVLFTGCVGGLQELRFRTRTLVRLWPITSAEPLTSPDTPRECDVMFHGSLVGWRKTGVPVQFERWQMEDLKCCDVSGAFNQALNARLRTTKVVWNPSHSIVRTVNMWRFWQATAAGAVWMPDDYVGPTWPAVRGIHYFDVHAHCGPDLVHEAQKLLQVFTPRACFDAYLRPAWQELSR